MSEIKYSWQGDTSRLDQKLQEHSHSDCYPFHMPGHKRRTIDFSDLYSLDITEIEGFDNLHHSQGILKEAQQRAANLYGADETFYLVNGSTAGILSAVSAALPRLGTLLMSRNSHKSAYHAACLRGLETVYLLPAASEFGISGSVSPAHVAQALEDLPQIAAVFITSPTYDGVTSDIRTIAEIVHAYNLPLIVDEAHGAHFAFSEEFPEPALSCGADLVIHSLHKTLPSFTQTALLHVNSERIDRDALKHFLSVYQTSSPSYLLMMSMDQCVRFMEEKGPSLMEEYVLQLKLFYQQAKSLKHVKIFDKTSVSEDICFDQDISKILISVGNSDMTGQKLYHKLLNTYHLQMEMCAGHYTTALTSIMDTPEGFQRLFRALKETDERISVSSGNSGTGSKVIYGSKRPGRSRLLTSNDIYQNPKPQMPIALAMEQPSERLSLKASTGHISQEFVYLYPPGIPLIAPGEILTGKIIRIVDLCQKQGLSVEGLSDQSNQSIKVVKL
ncbi:MAG: aminotransferase class I/II-fold pyridoxal phosphate-dependent enzyme [Lachnospiraceae bacterium]|nr:aminotransferase class I/II-fold pyridoxal phosphate-dependent enzyme [Lachnospiraceae bacterium]